MYLIKWYYHIHYATSSPRDARQWLRDHAGVSYWSWLRGRFGEGWRVDFV